MYLSKNKCKSLTYFYLSIIITALFACESTPPEILYSTEKVLTQSFGEPLSLYDTCDPTEDNSGQTADGTLEKINGCNLDLLSKCIAGNEEACQEQAPVCYTDPEDQSYCSISCETNEECGEGNLCRDEFCMSSEQYLALEEAITARYEPAKEIFDECDEKSSI